jgi:hypothetical protein
VRCVPWLCIDLLPSTFPAIEAGLTLFVLQFIWGRVREYVTDPDGTSSYNIYLAWIPRNLQIAAGLTLASITLAVLMLLAAVKSCTRCGVRDGWNPCVDVGGCTARLLGCFFRGRVRGARDGAGAAHAPNERKWRVCVLSLVYGPIMLALVVLLGLGGAGVRRAIMDEPASTTTSNCDPVRRRGGWGGRGMGAFVACCLLSVVCCCPPSTVAVDCC